MIKRVSIKNFQSHKDTCLNLDPGLNVIVGDTDSGKTAIIRALRWLMWNRPSGEAFRSHWRGKTMVEIITTTKDNQDESIITRTKDTDNTYILGDKHFKAFGTDVPEEITSALNINEINLQQQLDRPFLLTDSPGEVARYFNEVVNLDKIDKGLKNVQREIRSIEQDIKYTKEILKETQQELKKFEHLDKMEIDIEVLEEMEEQLTSKRSAVHKLMNLILDYEGINDEITRKQVFLEMDEEVTRLLILIANREELKESMITLEALITECTDLTNKINDSEEIVSIGKEVDTILEMIHKQEQLKESCTNLRDLITKLEDIKNKIIKGKVNLKELEEQFHKEMPDMCPLCNQKIKK